MALTAYTDGGARGNPGPAAIGIVLVRDGKAVRRHRERIGIATNNQAEYRAAIRALELARGLDSEIRCVTDSQLLCRQASGTYRIRNPILLELHSLLKSREQAFRTVSYESVRRTHPFIRLADRLVNEALGKKEP